MALGCGGILESGTGGRGILGSFTVGVGNFRKWHWGVRGILGSGTGVWGNFLGSGTGVCFFYNLIDILEEILIYEYLSQ